MGKQTVFLPSFPSILESAAVVGKKEGEGPLSKYFDLVFKDSYFGEKTWEKAESKMIKSAMEKVLSKAGLKKEDIDYIFGGDLLNQCVGTSYGVLDMKVPFFGLYGACSTMAESLSLASMMVDGDFCDKAMAITSSHFCSAERQFRFPLEYGGQRTPNSQWTVTGSGAVIVEKSSKPPYISHITTGKIVDFKICDCNNMGAAMAPAAADTIVAHLEDTGRTPDYYDIIATGDLGRVGSDILLELIKMNGYSIEKNHKDCGLLIFNTKSQDVHAGGSGCGCSASTLAGYLINLLRSGKINNLLFVATGALMSPTTTQQGSSIPGIAHAVAITNEKQEKR